MLDETIKAMYWNDLPIGRENAVTYTVLCDLWQVSERKARAILHELSLFDNGDDYILIRSSNGKGFYKTDKADEMKAYRRECLSKGRSVFAPVKKINRVLSNDAEQYSLTNNMRVIREQRGLKQRVVCAEMKRYDRAFDISLLSKYENGVCMPTPYQLAKIAQIYGVEPFELIDGELCY